MKKLYRISLKYLQFYFFKCIDFFFFKFEFKIIPDITSFDKLSFEYSNKTRRLVLRKDKKKFDKIYFDGTHSETELCILGRKFKTNKSSLNLDGHRSGYTGFYSIIFQHLKEKNCNFAEIGIEKNGSTKMWRRYFTKALIYCFEKNEEKINFAKKQKLNNVKYLHIDVQNPATIKKSFTKTNKKFDVIIDDSTHEFEHQINIIHNVHKYLKKGGFLIIEDIYKFRENHMEKKYYEKIKSLKKIFSKISFVEFSHVNNFTASWKCEKILYLIKK